MLKDLRKYTSSSRLNIPKLLLPTLFMLPQSISEYPVLRINSPFPSLTLSATLNTHFVSPASAASLSTAPNLLSSSAFNALCITSSSERGVNVDDEVDDNFWRLEDGTSGVWGLDAGVEAAARCINLICR